MRVEFDGRGQPTPGDKAGGGLYKHTGGLVAWRNAGRAFFNLNFLPTSLSVSSPCSSPPPVPQSIMVRVANL